MPWLFPRTVLKYVSGIFFGFKCKISFFLKQVSLVTQVVKNLPATQETWVWSLGREDLLEKEITTHSSILAWRIPSIEEPEELQSIGSQKIQRQVGNWTQHSELRYENTKMFWAKIDYTLAHIFSTTKIE